MNLAGSVSGAALEAYFRAADVFVLASDHEGFCVPLAEAMGHGVPIVAYGVTAVPETVGGAGLVLDDKSPVPFAAAVARVLQDAMLRAVLVRAGRERAAGFDLEASTRRFVSLVRQAVGAPQGGDRCQPRSAATRSTARSPAEGRSKVATRRLAARASFSLSPGSPSTLVTAPASA